VICLAGGMLGVEWGTREVESDQGRKRKGLKWSGGHGCPAVGDSEN
jgi:hypothetical protein